MDDEELRNELVALSKHAHDEIKFVRTHFGWMATSLAIVISVGAAMLFYFNGRSVEQIRLNIEKDVTARIDREFEQEKISKLIQATAELKVAERVDKEISRSVGSMFQVVLLTSEAKDAQKRDAYDALNDYASGDYPPDVVRLAQLAVKSTEDELSRVAAYEGVAPPDGLTRESSLSEILAALSNKDSKLREGVFDLFYKPIEGQSTAIPAIIEHLRSEDNLAVLIKGFQALEHISGVGSYPTDFRYWYEWLQSGIDELPMTQ